MQLDCLEAIAMLQVKSDDISDLAQGSASFYVKTTCCFYCFAIGARLCTNRLFIKVGGIVCQPLVRERITNVSIYFGSIFNGIWIGHLKFRREKGFQG